ncbi:hypothetical protein [Candidatus Nitrospira bockiana]
MKTIDELDLHPTARIPAEQLQTRFPFIRFLSGRRSLEEQARAMADNVLQQRDWVRATYRRRDRPSFAIAQEVQGWIDAHPEVTNVHALAKGIYGVLVSNPHGALISFHPAGLAFDFDLWRPEPLVKRENGAVVLTELGREVQAFIRQLPNYDAFVTREGNLIIGHAQFLERAVQV